MKKTIFIVLAILSGTITIKAQKMKTFYDFEAKTIDGKILKMSDYKGKKILVVNTASKCGYTPQYKELEALNKKYGGEKFAIIGFPENNFLWQEPGSDKEIKEFCTVNYGVTFQMMSKISVKGKDMHPLYQWLTQKSENGVLDAPVKWNFQKFMIDENGKLVDYAPPSESPSSDKIVKWIEGTK